MRILLLSTYELGHQPLGITGAAAALLAAGHEVEAADLSIDPWPSAPLERADAVALSVPMHTATELALTAAARIRSLRNDLRIAFHGLYATELRGHPLLRPGDLLATGETGEALVDWASRPVAGMGAGVSVVKDLGPASLPPGPPPARHLVAPLEQYVHLTASAGRVTVAGIESSRGCNHRCRHCPVASVYGGRSRALPLESVLADLDQVVGLGAGHVSLLDPDFLNRPRHALAVAEAMAERHPGITFDATIKVEHLLRHGRLVEKLARLGLTFVVSAFESTDDGVLALLDKGHTFADEERAVALLRRAGVEPQPSWLPFTPWATLASFASLLTFSARADLVPNTDLVQFSIRLLLPPSSLLLEDPDPVLATALTGEHGGWRHADPRLDELQQAVAELVESPGAGFGDLWSLARSFGVLLAARPPDPDPALASPIEPGARPRLSEAWFCCAEPTRTQIELVHG